MPNLIKKSLEKVFDKINENEIKIHQIENNLIHLNKESSQQFIDKYHSSLKTFLVYINKANTDQDVIELDETIIETLRNIK